MWSRPRVQASNRGNYHGSYFGCGLSTSGGAELGDVREHPGDTQYHPHHGAKARDVHMKDLTKKVDVVCQDSVEDLSNPASLQEIRRPATLIHASLQDYKLA